MRPLFRLFIRGWLARPGRTLLAIGGVALGVAVLLAVRVANSSAIEAFGRSLELIAGKTDVEIYAEGEGSIDPGIYRSFTRMPGVRSAAPVYIRRARAGEQERTVKLMGVDLARDSELRPWYRAELADTTSPLALFTTPNGALLSPSLAQELGVRTGDTFPLHHTGRVDTLLLLGILEGEEVSKAQIADLVIMDLPRAWRLTGDWGELHRVDLLFREGVNQDSALTAVRTFLSDGLTAKAAGWRRPQAEQMLASFRLNLTALAFVALLVAGFLVYQTVTAAAIQRRRLTGILRAVGSGRRFVVRFYLLEGIGLGLLGALAGVPLGLLFARGAVRAVQTTVSTLYLLEGARGWYVTWDEVVTSALLGIVVAVAAVTPVALEAARIPPRESFSRQTLEDRLKPLRYLVFGLLGMALGTLLAFYPLQAYPVMSGYGAAALWVFGTALATPWLLGVGHTLALKVVAFRLGARVRMVLGLLVRSRHRTAPAVAALAFAAAMWLSVDMMVRSFRNTVEIWYANTITADLIITGSGSFQINKNEPIPSRVLDSLLANDQLADIDCFRNVGVMVDGVEVRLAMTLMESVARQDRLQFLETLPDQSPYEAILRGDPACIISETMAFHQDLDVGDSVTVTTPSGDQKLFVTSVYYDYSYDAGLMLVDRAWFAEMWGDDRPSSIAIYLPEGVSGEEGRAIVRRSLPEELELDIHTNEQLREAVLEVFDHTFAITYALEAVAVIVALLAVGGGMAAIVTEQSREHAIFRAIGGSQRQLIGRVLAESGLLGFAGWLIGSGLGIVLSLILIYVINKHSFGWSLGLQIQWGQILLAGALMVLSSLLAGLLPAMRASKTEIATQVRMEYE